MSMITLNGQLMHVFDQPARKGTEDPEKPKIQIMGELPLPNGQTRFDLITITVKNPRKYEDLVGTEVSVPVGAFAPGKGTVIFFEQGS